MVTSLKPEVTAQLARIAANVGPWAALNGAGTPADLARLPPVINEQVEYTRHTYYEIYRYSLLVKTSVSIFSHGEHACSNFCS